MSALISDVELPHVVLDIMAKHLHIKGKIDVSARVVDATLDRSIDAASTLTISVDDGDRELLRSGALGVQQLGFKAVPQSQVVPLDVKVDGLWYRMVQVQKQQNTLQLTFEDRIVSLLRLQIAPRKALRAQMTRAEFALSMLREIKVGGPYPFICPELYVTQGIAPITNSGQKLTSSQRKQGVAYGLNPDAHLTVKGRPATKSQKRIGEQVLDVANSLSAGPTATLALVEACIVESSMSNLNYGDSTSKGVLQVLASTAAGIGISATDVQACAHTFLTRGFYRGGAIPNAAKYPNLSAGAIAQLAQGSAYPSRYDQVQNEAQSWVDAYTGGKSGSALGPTKSQEKIVPYYFQRGGTDGKKVEDSWTCMQRLASEVQWRCFCADGAIYFVNDETLLSQKPDAWVTEFQKGVDGIDFQIDNGKAKSDVTLTARTLLHGFPPGACIEVYDCGPADGRWLVKEHQRGVFDPLAQITLTRAVKPLLEPAPSTKAVTSATGPTGPVPAGLSAGVQRAYQQAMTLNAQQYPYVWGGGHARCGYPDKGIGGAGRPGGDIGDTGYDCSGSTCAVLAAAGFGFRKGGPVKTSGALESWGAAGPGQTMTVWASGVHVWIEFKTTNGDQAFTTGWEYGSKRWSGPGFVPIAHGPAKGSFTPRHWPGT